MTDSAETIAGHGAHRGLQAFLAGLRLDSRFSREKYARNQGGRHSFDGERSGHISPGAILVACPRPGGAGASAAIACSHSGSRPTTGPVPPGPSPSVSGAATAISAGYGQLARSRAPVGSSAGATTATASSGTGQLPTTAPRLPFRALSAASGRLRPARRSPAALRAQAGSSAGATTATASSGTGQLPTTAPRLPFRALSASGPSPPARLLAARSRAQAGQVLGLQRIRRAGGRDDNRPPHAGRCLRPSQRRDRDRGRLPPRLRPHEYRRGQVLGLQPLRPARGRHDDRPPDAGRRLWPRRRRDRDHCWRSPQLCPHECRRGQVLGQQPLWRARGWGRQPAG